MPEKSGVWAYTPMFVDSFALVCVKKALFSL